MRTIDPASRRRLALVPILSLVLAGAAPSMWASEQGGAVCEEPETPVTAAFVAVRVVDEAGRAVPEPHVYEPGHWSTRITRPPVVQEDGSFLVEVSPGTVRLQALARGYLPSAPVVLELAAGERRDGVELVLQPAAVVRGRVMAADGSPVPSARIAVRTGGAGPASVGATSTDAEGRFELHSAPGPVSLRAWKEGYAPILRELDVAPQGATIELHLGRGAEVSGRVVGPDGEPAPGRRVVLSPRTPSGRLHEGLSAGDGTFRFRNVADGVYGLQVAAFAGRGLSGDTYEHPEEVIVEGSVPLQGVVVWLPQRATVRGRLLGVTPDELSHLSLHAYGGEESHGRRQGTVLQDGRYEVGGLGPGRWRVSAIVAGSGKSVEATLHVEPGQAETVLDLELRAGVTIAGTVLWNGEPAADVRVGTLPPPQGSGREAVTGADGRFELSGLRPGRQDLSLAAPDRGFGDLRSVEVYGGEVLLLEIETARLRGTVLSAAGREPIVAAAVVLEPPPGNPQRRAGRRGETDENGEFSFEGIAPGGYRLHVEKLGYGAYATPVEVAAGETVVPPMVLERAAERP